MQFKMTTPGPLLQKYVKPATLNYPKLISEAI